VTFKKILVTFAALTLAACIQGSGLSKDQKAFFKSISDLCGKSFAGKVISKDKADADFASERLVMHVRECTKSQILIPFNVGDNRSRTWVLTKSADGLRLKHDHRHDDGTSDVVTMYGGDTTGEGTSTRQEFPVDQFSKDLFVKEGLDVSVTNVWAMEIYPDDKFAYELRRPNRFFRVDFDLTHPIETPDASWGFEKG